MVDVFTAATPASMLKQHSGHTDEELPCAKNGILIFLALYLLLCYYETEGSLLENDLHSSSQSQDSYVQYIMPYQ